MTLTPWDFALAAMAAPEPESRLTSSRTFAPLVIACSACCCCVDLSPSAFWIVDSTPALSKACLSSGRSSVSQRPDDLESGSRTATLPGLAPPEPPPPDDPLLLDESSLPHAATASDSPAATVAISHAPLFTELLLMGVAPPPGVSASRPVRPLDATGGRARPPRGRARWRRGPRRGRRASRRRRWRPPPRSAGHRGRASRERRRAAAPPRPRGRRRRSAAPG